MKRHRAGGVIAKYLLLMLMIALLFAFFVWKQSYGTIGHVEHIEGSTAGKIAFLRSTDGRTDLFLVDAAGGQASPLTNDGTAKRAPAWAPDGRQICYAAEPPAGEGGRAFQLFLVGSSSPTQATYGSLSKDQPLWRADGKQIAFLTGGVVKVIAPNGSGLDQLYPRPRKKAAGEADGHDHEEGEDEEGEGKRPPIMTYRWSPNGKSIAAVEVTEGENALTIGTPRWWDEQEKSAVARQTESAPRVAEPERVVLIRDVDEGGALRLPGAAANRVGVFWYPDGIHLGVSMSTREGAHGIALYRADDPQANPTGLFAAAGYTAAPENPALSPDGKWLAFELWRMESPENRTLLGIAVVSAEPATPHRVLSCADVSRLPVRIRGNAQRPQWSPDGKRLLYIMPGAQGRDIWVANADGTNPVNLTRGVGDNFDAVWSPALR